MDLQLRREGCGSLVNNNFADEFLAIPWLPLRGGLHPFSVLQIYSSCQCSIAALAGGCGLFCRINSWTNFGHTVGGLQLHFGIELCRFYFIIPTSHFQVVDRTTRCCYEMQPSLRNLSGYGLSLSELSRLWTECNPFQVRKPGFRRIRAPPRGSFTPCVFPRFVTVVAWSNPWQLLHACFRLSAQWTRLREWKRSGRDA